LLFLLLVFVLGCARTETRTARIGLVSGLTGPTAAWGTAIKRGAELAIDDARAAGTAVELRVEDDQGKPEGSVLAAETLIGRDGVTAIVGADTSGRTLAIAPLAERHHIAVVSPTASAPQVTRGRHFVFRVCATDDLEAIALAQIARNELHAKRAVILRDTKNDYSVGIAETFTRSFTSRGGSVAGVFDYAEEDSDFRAQLTGAKALAPDVVLIPGYYGEVAQLAVQARDLGLTVPLLGGSGWDSAKLVEIGGKSVEGGTFVSGLRSASPKFVAAFRKRFGSDPDSASAEAYDATMIVARAIARAGADRARVRDAVAATHDFPGASGTITLGPDGNALKILGVYRVVGGCFEQVGTTKR
jgi:branched-chain amino acid transport system substrate-binding protein